MAASKGGKGSKPIKIKAANKGKLHETLGVPQGQNIPQSKLEAAARSSNPTTRKRAQFALNAEKFDHTGGAKKTAAKKATPKKKGS